VDFFFTSAGKLSGEKSCHGKNCFLFLAANMELDSIA